MSDDSVKPTDASRRGAIPPIAAAMEILAEAEVVANATRSEADRYARQREAEADLLVQKARRVLMAAEGKAAAIVATARARGAVVDDQVIDLDDPATGATPGGAPRHDSTMDKVLESAIARAVSDALSPETPS